MLGENVTTARKVAKAKLHPTSERLLRMRLRMHSDYVSDIAVHAPTNEEGNEEAEWSYVEVQEVVCDMPKWDMLLILGDFNTRVSCDDETWTGVTSRHSPDEKNENARTIV